MKIKSKIVSFIAAALAVFSLAAYSFAATAPFTDLKNVAGGETVLALQKKGYINGVGNNKFAPYKTVAAAEGIQLIVSGLGLNIDNIKFIKAPKASDYFTKADDDAWYADAFIIASLNGLDLPRDLDPKEKWSREQFTYYLTKGMETKGNLPMINIVPAKIADEKQITIDFSGGIQRALHYGLVSLDKKGNFNPKRKITRIEAVGELYNAIKYLENHPAPDINKENPVTE